MNKNAKSWLRHAGMAGALVFWAHGAACTGVIDEPTAGLDQAPRSPGAGGAGVGAGTGVGSGGSKGGIGGDGANPYRQSVWTKPSLRRLTEQQFENTLVALLGSVQTVPVEGDIRAGGTSTIGASTVATTPRGVEMYETAVTNALSQIFFDQARRTAFAGCTPAAGAADPCTRMFVERFGQRAWRRPLTPEEITRHVGVGELAAKALGDANAGPRWAATSLLQSFNFLYRPEIGTPDPKDKSRRRLTSWELASRLSYFLLNGPPDEMLMQAAAAGELDTAEGLASHAQRLAGKPQAQKAIAQFAEDLLSLGRVATIPKDAKLFPKFTDTIRQAFVTELERMWAVAYAGGSALDLFTSRTRYVTKDLATYYGLPTTNVSATAPTAVTIADASPRVGLLGSGGLMAIYAGQKETSPTHRGKFVREVLLCQVIPPPPPNIDTNLPDPPAGIVMTKRQRLEGHMNNPSCAGCHALTDIPGFAMENFDAVGAFRTTDSGLKVDPSGTFEGTPFEGLPGFAQAVVDQGAPRCLARHLMEAGQGRSLAMGQEPLLDRMAMRFMAGGYKLASLLTEVAADDSFRFVAAF